MASPITDAMTCALGGGTALPMRSLQAWSLKACDLLYLIGGRPSDTLRFLDAAFEIRTSAAGRSGVLNYRTSKTDTPIEIEINEAVIEVVEWFRAWKSRNGLLSKYLICYPPYVRKRHIGKPVSASYLSGRWRECAIAAGFEPGQYWLYDLRKKSMTDEQRTQGRHNKGGHRTESSRELYILDEVPIRSSAKLVALKRG
jgi:hypothetical protein